MHGKFWTPDFDGSRPDVAPRSLNPRINPMGASSLEVLNDYLQNGDDHPKKHNSDNESMSSNDEDDPHEGDLVDILPVSLRTITNTAPTPPQNNSPTNSAKHSPRSPLASNWYEQDQDQDQDPSDPPSPRRPALSAWTEVPIHHVWRRVSMVKRGIRCAFHANRFRNWSHRWRCERCELHACNACRRRLNNNRRGGCSGLNELRRQRTA